MDRRKTIVMAVFVNVGLLAVLLIAALTTQEEEVSITPAVVEAPLVLPAFEEPLHVIEPVPVAEAPVHRLPQMVEPDPMPEPVAVAVAADAAPSQNEVVVKKGDSLDKIAKAHHTTVAEIVKFNHLASNVLKIGQVLKIPPATAKPIVKASEQTAASAEYYTMKVGETPWAIAIKHHMKLDELLRLNGLNEEKARKLKPGDRLRIK